jgi:hypothetical protein
MTILTFNIRDMQLQIATRPNGQVLFERVANVLNSEDG